MCSLLSKQGRIGHHRCVTPLYRIPVWNFDCVLDCIAGTGRGLCLHGAFIFPGTAQARWETLPERAGYFNFNTHTSPSTTFLNAFSIPVPLHFCRACKMFYRLLHPAYIPAD